VEHIGDGNLKMTARKAKKERGTAVKPARKRKTRVAEPQLREAIRQAISAARQQRATEEEAAIDATIAALRAQFPATPAQMEPWSAALARANAQLAQIEARLWLLEDQARCAEKDYARLRLREQEFLPSRPVFYEIPLGLRYLVATQTQTPKPGG